MAFFIKKTQSHGGTEKNNTFSEDTENNIKFPEDKERK